MRIMQQNHGNYYSICGLFWYIILVGGLIVGNEGLYYIGIIQGLYSLVPDESPVS